MERPSSSGRRRWWRLPFWLAVCGAVGATAAGVMFASWTRMLPVDLEEGHPDAFALKHAELPDARPYLHFDAEGHLMVNRDLEGEPQSLQGLGLLLWLPASETLSETSIPWWFVRLKLSDGLHLGSLTALVSGDWQAMNLPVGAAQLSRRGPGLVLDETRRDGARLLLWTY